MFYKIRALKEQSVKIHLHCFAYGRKPSPELENMCEEVFYYERKTGLASFLSFLPYNVKSRQSVELENNLLKDNHPVLCEVLHTCYLLDDPRFKNRKKIYRHSNIEHEYYLELSKAEKKIFKKIYLKIEAWKLKGFEKILKSADVILAVNKKDTVYFQNKFPEAKTYYLPSFHANKKLEVKEGQGAYVLFHGNLSVSENYEAVEWLIHRVFSQVQTPCVIAGLNPPDFLKNLIQGYKHIRLIANPSELEMNELITNAQIHVLYTAQSTGLKLKLLNVLFKGRFVICNSHMISGTDVKEDDTLFVCENEKQFIDKINQWMLPNFSASHLASRQHNTGVFDTIENARRLISALNF